MTDASTNGGKRRPSISFVFDELGHPRVPQLIIDWGLYDPVVPEGENKEQAIRRWLWKWAGADYRFDCYCTQCSRESIFTSTGGAQVKKDEKYIPPIGISSRSISSRPQLVLGEYPRTFLCNRVFEHKLLVYLSITDTHIVKIGQSPSFADIAFPALARFRAILGADRVHELQRASGLFSHGIGAGSLIYLRRTLEAILKIALMEAQENGMELSPNFERLRFDEKVLLVKDFLPQEFVDNRELYSLVSAGVHALSEAECLSIFPVTFDGIELALSAELTRREQRQKAIAMRQKVAAKTNEITQLLNKDTAKKESVPDK